MAFKKVQSQATALYSSISAAATSMKVTPYPVDLDGNKLTMAALGSTPQVTVDSKVFQIEEIIGFTAITDNGDNTATLTGLSRDLASSSLATPGTGKAHGSGATVIISWNPQDVARLAALENDNVFTGNNTAPNPTSPQSIVTRDWILALIAGGSITTNALIEAGKAGETVAAGNVIYLKAADGQWWLAKSAVTATIDALQLGIAQGAGTAGNAIAGGVLRKGLDSNQAGGVAGGLGYVKDAGGTVNTTAGTLERIVGQFITATTFVFDPVFYYTLTANQKAAMQTTVAPSSTNKFLTQNDVDSITITPIVKTYTAHGGTFTVTIASPAVFTSTAHGYVANDKVIISTTGTLPTGLVAGTVYYVISAGLTSNAFEISATLGGSAINTSGAQSGTHTVNSAWEKPATLKYVKVEIVGAGGGGGNSNNAGSSGGTTTFKSMTAGGGLGAITSTGGVASGGDLNITGGSGGDYGGFGGSGHSSGAIGGNSFFGGGGSGYAGTGTNGGGGGGANGAGAGSGWTNGSSGGAGGYAMKIYVASALSSIETLVVGKFGAASGGGDGSSGMIIITEYYIF
jgi:hypothetical protein